MDKYAAKPQINIFDGISTSRMMANKGIPDFSISTKKNNSILATDLLPLHNKKDDRFQTDILINGKTHFEETNTIIKSLEEEIVTMKHKLSFVYEKDEEIGKLKGQINELKKDNKELQSGSQALAKLRIEHKQTKDQLDIASMRSHNKDKLLSENRLLRNKLKALTRDDVADANAGANADANAGANAGANAVADDSLFIEEIDEFDEYNEYNEFDDSDSDEMMDINIPQLKSVLSRRLRDKQTQHIDNLIESYNLRKKNRVKKSIMEKMLEEAIHL